MPGSEVEAPQPHDPDSGICTETLARLYLKQGFVEHALAMYRRLVQAQPGNQQLYEHLRTLEQQLALGALEHDTVVPSSVPHTTVDSAMRTTEHQGHQVVVQLERWLHYLQRQRQHRPQP